MNSVRKFTLAAALAFASVAVHAQATEGPDGLSLHLASTAADLSATEYLGVARAAKRIVAVGEHGTIALSDDGKSWRQARHVPVQSTLTSVAFSDAMHGWAVGHWGVVIHTDDGGETWSLQRSDLKVDQPLFSVYFKNSTEGFAVGLWSLLLKTSDGGRTWTQSKLMSDKKEGADKNLFQLFSSRDGTLYISAEKGTVFCSTDAGATWTGIPTGYSGSLWTGVALSDGALLVGGLRGSMLRSDDAGKTWLPLKTDTSSSITDIVQMPNHEVIAVGLDGVTLQSNDNGQHFQRMVGPDRANYTAVIAKSDGQPVYFTARGIAIDH
jgi:photosystem II stability/assembly factor-like uncharacterized protein